MNLFYRFLTSAILFSVFCNGQSKTIIGILSFKGESQSRYYNRGQGNNYVVEIQDAVTDAFMKTKRFSLVDREKMDQLNSEKELQKSEDFIDGKVIEQSKSLGAQYIVTGNVTEASVKQGSSYAPVVGRIATNDAEVSFSIKVVDVTTGEIVASGSFSGKGRGKEAFENALDDIRPDIEKFITENFKVVLSLASVEEKNDKGEATKVLVAGGTSLGLKEGNELKVYELQELEVDGKKLPHKVEIGKVTVTKVEDENFSECSVNNGGDLIAKKQAAGSKIKCEIIND